MATHTREALAVRLPLWEPEGSAPVWREARNEFVIATDGTRYIDTQMGHGACLWGHATVYERVLAHYEAAQLAQGLGGQHTTRLREEAEARLARWAARWWQAGEPIGTGLLHTGAEAVETAVKTAVAATRRPDVVVFEHAYHGSYGLSAVLSHAPSGRDAFASMLRADSVRRVPFGSVPTLDERVACVLVEPIQGAGGVLVPDDGFLPGLRRACDKAGALLVVDDVLAGCGRSGEPLAGADANPDVIAVAKALGGGMIAAAVLCRRSVAERAWKGDDAPSLHTTYYGHPFTSAAVLETLDLLEHADLDELCAPIEAAVRDIGRRAGVEVRGRGAFWAVELGDKSAGKQLADRLLAQHHVIVAPAGPEESAIQLLPCLTMQPDSLEAMVDAIVSEIR